MMGSCRGKSLNFNVDFVKQLMGKHYPSTVLHFTLLAMDIRFVHVLL